MILFSKLLSKVLTGATAFVVSGVLVTAILENNGGAENSQKAWQEAKLNAVSLEHDTLIAMAQNTSQPDIDDMITGSVHNIADDKGEEQAAFETQSQVQTPVVEEELSVLALIRNNSDVVPSVSSGTDRVSIIVKPGDTLYGISNKHGLGIEELASMNGLKEPYNIQIGQTLYVAR